MTCCAPAQVVTLDMGLLVAGTKYRGEFAERLKKLMDEIKQNDDVILMIDEVGAGRWWEAADGRDKQNDDVVLIIDKVSVGG